MKIGVTDQHVCAMVDLLVTQRLTDYRADLTETDTKLAYHGEDQQAISADLPSSY